MAKPQSYSLQEVSNLSDYGIGIVGKCLGPTTSKGPRPTKDGFRMAYSG